MKRKWDQMTEIVYEDTHAQQKHENKHTQNDDENICWEYFVSCKRIAYRLIIEGFVGLSIRQRQKQ